MLKYPGQEDMVLVDLKMDFYRSGAYHSTLTADSGRANRHSRNVHAWGDVVVVTEDVIDHPVAGEVVRVLVEITRRGRAAVRPSPGRPVRRRRPAEDCGARSRTAPDYRRGGAVVTSLRASVRAPSARAAMARARSRSTRRTLRSAKIRPRASAPAAVKTTARARV